MSYKTKTMSHTITTEFRGSVFIEDVITLAECSICEHSLDEDLLVEEINASQKKVCIACIRNLQLEDINEIFDTGGDTELTQAVFNQLKSELK